MTIRIAVVRTSFPSVRKREIDQRAIRLFRRDVWAHFASSSKMIK